MSSFLVMKNERGLHALTQLSDQIYCKLEKDIEIQVGINIHEYLGSQLLRQIGNQVWLELRNRIWEQICTEYLQTSQRLRCDFAL